MIFVTLGSQKFQFDRLLKALDSQVGSGLIGDPVFAQTGCSTYVPQHFPSVPFLNRDEFAARTEEADVIICHAGTGAIVGALKKGKKVIVVPRLKQYGEHVDDHQTQIAETFAGSGMILRCDDCDRLAEVYQQILGMTFPPYRSNNKAYLDYITDYLLNG